MLEATEERDDSTDEVTLAAEDPTEEEDVGVVTATPVAEDEAEEVAVEAIVDVQDTASESRRQYLLEYKKD
jgi:hypothetical protein